MNTRILVHALATVTVLVASGCSAEAGDEDDIAELEQAASKQAAPEAPPPANGDVSFGVEQKERAYGVGIQDKQHDKPKVIYSVRVKDLAADEELRIRGEVTLSRCNDKDVAGQSGDAKLTPCTSKEMKKNPYTYAPRFGATVVLGSSPSDTTGKRLASWSDTVCSENEHHCTIALPEVAARKLGALADKYVNFVVSADANGKDAHSWDVMEVEQGHGALFVTRMAAGAENHAYFKASKNPLAKGNMGIDQTEDESDKTQVKRLLYQVRLDNLKPGDVVDVSGKFKAVLGGGFSCDPLITSTVFLTSDKQALEPGKAGDVSMGVRNGHNCTDHSGNGCKYEKSVAGRVGNGASPTMYVSWTATALRSCAAPNGGDTWHLAPNDGLLEANVRR